MTLSSLTFVAKLTRQDGQDTPEKDLDDPEPKSTPSSSRPPSSLSVGTTQSSIATPTPTPPPVSFSRGVSHESMEHPPPEPVIKSPNEDDVMKNIAKPPKKRKTIDEPEPDIAPSYFPNKRPMIYLHEWVNQRVLAKKDNMYCSGVIKKIFQNRNIGVLFDGENEVTNFMDVLDSRNCPIVGDNAPSAMMISIGSFVCVRTDIEKNVYYEGQIMEKKPQQPVLYLVKLINHGPGMQTVQVPRSSIRLLQPPWYEDLEEGIMEQPAPTPPVTPTAPQHTYQFQVSILDTQKMLGAYSTKLC